MATDGPTPPACDPDIFKNGTNVFQTDTIPSNAMECWVRKVAEKSGQPVDWSFMGGQAFVKALGDIGAVVAAIKELKSEHDKLYWDIIQKDFAFMYNPERPTSETPGKFL